MNVLTIALLGALLSTNPAVATSNLVARTTGVAVPLVDPNDPVEKEYRQLLEQDDKARAEVDRWIEENNAFAAKGAGVERAVLALKIEQRLEPVAKAYEDFLLRHSEHTRARLAFGGLLDEMGREDDAVAQWERARETDPNDPAIWNNLAGHYGHRGPVTNAFKYYEKAMELKPNEPLYCQNLATVVYLFRKDAQEYYQTDEAHVFQKALDLYQKAMKLDPKNFVLANDWAQSYYGLRPPRPEEAVAAWNHVLTLAKDRLQTEGVLIHLARTEITLGRFQSASNRLAQVTNEVYQVLKERVMRNLRDKEAKQSPSRPAASETKP